MGKGPIAIGVASPRDRPSWWTDPITDEASPPHAWEIQQRFSDVIGIAMLVDVLVQSGRPFLEEPTIHKGRHGPVDEAQAERLYFCRHGGIRVWNVGGSAATPWPASPARRARRPISAASATTSSARIFATTFARRHPLRHAAASSGTLPARSWIWSAVPSARMCTTLGASVGLWKPRPDLGLWAQAKVLYHGGATSGTAKRPKRAFPCRGEVMAAVCARWPEPSRMIFASTHRQRASGSLSHGICRFCSCQ